MWHEQLALAWLGALWLGCNPPGPVAQPTAHSTTTKAPNARTEASTPRTPEPAPKTPAPSPAPAPPPTQLDPDGSGAPDPPGEGKLEVGGHFERLGRHWGALHRICDMQRFGEALILAHATRPLVWDGATITRYPLTPKPVPGPLARVEVLARIAS